MTLWFRRVADLDSETMRQIATDAGVDWNPQAIIYRGRGIGYKNGDATDTKAIQDAGQKLLGKQLVNIDAPPQQEPPQ
jgi:hypothetical protein